MAGEVLAEDVVAQTRATYDRVAVDYQRRSAAPTEEFARFRAGLMVHAVA